MSFRRSLAIFLLLSSFVTAWAQPTVQPVQIVITPNHDNWEYKAGESATFSSQVLKFGVPQKGLKIFYQEVCFGFL